MANPEIRYTQKQEWHQMLQVYICIHTNTRIYVYILTHLSVCLSIDLSVCLSIYDNHIREAINLREGTQKGLEGGR